MARQGAESEEVSMAEAGRRLGMTQQSIGVWATKSDAPVTMKGGRRYALWPQFPAWHRAQIANGLDELDRARLRKLNAEASQAELALAELEGQLVRIDDVTRVYGRHLDRIRSRIVAMPGRLAPQVVGVKTVAEATAIIDRAVREVLSELSAQDPVQRSAA